MTINSRKLIAQKGASKLSLSSLSSEELWQKSGRLEGISSELFRLQDRKNAKYLLSPTHEEEITFLVGSVVKSYKDLPLRLYQISRKYRDEPRPRQGLLRSREFLMKDLYTFDTRTTQALETYKNVRQAYSAFFNKLGVPYVASIASSGDIGGEISHEYHIPSSKGEDDIISCDSCGFVINTELSGKVAVRKSSPTIYCEPESSDIPCKVWAGITEGRDTLVIAIYPSKVQGRTATGDFWRSSEIHLAGMKNEFPDLDLSVEDPLAEFQKTPYPQRQIRGVYDYRLDKNESSLKIIESSLFKRIKDQLNDEFAKSAEVLKTSSADLVNIDTGDTCCACSEGILKVQKAIEIGHTFHLGDRYSKPLKATIAPDPSEPNANDTSTTTFKTSQPLPQIPIQMGCHGIGVSRLIAAIADHLADSKGLNWPAIIAPFQAVIVSTKDQGTEAAGVYDLLTSRSDSGDEEIDTIFDDRCKDFGWKLRDADMIGYPVIVVVGRDWKTEGKVEVQCRRLGVKEGVKAEGLREFVRGLLGRL